MSDVRRNEANIRSPQCVKVKSRGRVARLIRHDMAAELTVWSLARPGRTLAAVSRWRFEDQYPSPVQLAWPSRVKQALHNSSYEVPPHVPFQSDPAVREEALEEYIMLAWILRP